ncbi:MAG: SET domain-containing protein [Bryobacteraceae bacterium]
MARSSVTDAPRIDPRHCPFRLRVAPSTIHRWGVFAEERIPARRKVIEYTGERISRRETRRRAQGSLNYLFSLNSYWCLDGAVGGSGAEFINHCCDPNLYAWVFRGHILYMSKRIIEPGEELTIDYHFAKDVAKVPCSCGAPNCRGTINVK